MHADRALIQEALFRKALELVHQHRAASVALLQRHLGVSLESAESVLQRMASETTVVRRMQNGLFLYTHGPIGEELAALHGFAQVVLTALSQDNLDANQLRTAAIEFGLTTSSSTAPAGAT